MNINEIVELKKKRLNLEMDFVNAAEMEEIAKGIDRPTVSFRRALEENDMILIPEIKSVSDSGVAEMRLYEPDIMAQEVSRHKKVKALFVQTEKDVYKGSAGHLRAIRKVSDLPLVRRDYILTAYQMYESRAIGADAVLIIAALFSTESLTKIIALGKKLGLECVVEVHDRHEIERAIKAGAEIINIYNREVRSIETDAEKIGEYLEMISDTAAVIIEGGVSNPTEVKLAKELGIKGVVSGDFLINSTDYDRTLSWLESEI